VHPRALVAFLLFGTLFSGCGRIGYDPVRGPTDASTPDASTPDASTPDASTPDASTPDASSSDASDAMPEPDSGAVVCTGTDSDGDGTPNDCDPCGAGVIVRDGPSLYYRLGEASGSTVAVDRSGNGNDARYLDYVALGFGGRVDDGDSSAYFENGGDPRSAYFPTTFFLPRLQLNPVPPSFPSTAMTIEMHLKTSAINPAALVSYAVAGNSDEVRLNDPSNLTISVGVGSVTTGLNLSDGLWHHLAVTWQSSDGAYAVYVDGTLARMGTVSPGHVITGNGVLVLAQDQDSLAGGFQASESFLGWMDEVALFDTVLTESAIESHNEGTTRNGACTVDCVGVDIGSTSFCPARSCQAILQAGASSGNGTYWIDPDGALPTMESALTDCDMTFDFGGWTLLVSLANRDGPMQAHAGPARSGTSSYAPRPWMQVLTSSATQVHIRTQGQTDPVTGRWITSIPNSLPIQNLRAGRSMYINPSQDRVADWTGPFATPSKLDTNCNLVISTYPTTIYHACGNGGGLHFTDDFGLWVWAGGSTAPNENMELWVR
jgi:hypothetical protein